MESKLIGMDFEIDKTVGNEGEYGVKFNEPKTDCRIYSKWTRRGLPQEGAKQNGRTNISTEKN